MPTAKLLQISQIGHPVLREKTKLVENVRGRSIQNLINDMKYTCADANGVGLAAPQVYQPLKLFIASSRPLPPVYRNEPEIELKAFINPEIVSESDEKIPNWESCLSIPGIRGLVLRPKSIDVRYTNSEGQIEERTFEGLMARVFKHEKEHLDGVLYTDYTDPKTFMSEKEYQKMVTEMNKK